MNTRSVSVSFQNRIYSRKVSYHFRVTSIPFCLPQQPVLFFYVIILSFPSPTSCLVIIKSTAVFVSALTPSFLVHCFHPNSLYDSSSPVSITCHVVISHPLYFSPAVSLVIISAPLAISILLIINFSLCTSSLSSCDMLSFSMGP